MSACHLVEQNDEKPSKVHNPLEQFLVLARTSTGQACLDVIKQCLEAPGVYVFGELLTMENILEVIFQFDIRFLRGSLFEFILFFRFFSPLLIYKTLDDQLKDGPNAKYLNTLNLFAYGTFREYLTNKEHLIELTDVMKKKLQHLTIVSMAIQNKCIAYKDLLVALDVKNVRDLEDLIIESIYLGEFFQLASQFEGFNLNDLVQILFTGNWINGRNSWKWIMPLDGIFVLKVSARYPIHFRSGVILVS